MPAVSTFRAGEIREAGIISHRIFILLSCRGDKSAKPDSQQSADAPVELVLTALSDRMTHTPLSYTHIHQQTQVHRRMHEGPKWQRHQHVLGWESGELETKLSGVFSSFYRDFLLDRR